MSQQSRAQSSFLIPARQGFIFGSLSIAVLSYILSVTSLGQLGISLIAPYGEQATWYLIRSSGIIAYVLFGVSTISGLLMSSKLVKKIIPTPILFQSHQASSWIGLGLAGFHAVLLLFDSYFSFTVGNILIPFTGPYEPIWVGLGIVAW